ncbi:putative reverse transcriptase domain-containing protein [Tanacetum coccineum]
MPTTRHGLNSAAIEQLIAQCVANAIAAYKANQNSVDAAYETTWEELKKMLTEEYCPRNDIQKMETELWNLTVKGTDVVGFTRRFQELALLCLTMVTLKYKKVERYFWGLTNDIQGKEDDRKSNSDQQQNKRHEVGRVYATGTGNKTGYAGTLSLCDRSNLHYHHDPCPAQCGNCWKVGHQARDCRTPTSVTCYECGEKGHTRKYCPF